MSILPRSAYDISLPEMMKVTQIFPDEKLSNVQKEVDDEFIEKEQKLKINKDMRIAVLVGSRGICDLDKVVKHTIDNIKKLGGEPFIVPAMGSHGGGIAEEQKRIVEGYGVTEKTMGVPIVSSMETKIIGQTLGGVPVHFDKNALNADAVVPIGRVKVHTDFDGPIESGLCKMLAIGGGKHNGCSRLHQEGFDNFPELIPEVATVILNNINVIFGVAIIENAHEHLYTVEVVPSDEIMEREPQLLKISKSLMPRLQFDEIDVLVVDQIGKDVTGAGMDPNITGRKSVGPIAGFEGPYIKRILVKGLSPGTHNNGTGVGIADYITKNVFETIDLTATYTNCIASGNPEAGKLPIIVENEEEGLRAAIQTCRDIDANDAKVVRIKDTLHLIDIEISKNMLKLCRDIRKFSIG